MSHHGSILALPSGVYDWNPSPDGLTVEDVRGVLAEALEGAPRCTFVEADVCRADLLVEIEATGEAMTGASA